MSLPNDERICLECKYYREYESPMCNLFVCGTDANTKACEDFARAIGNDEKESE